MFTLKTFASAVTLAAAVLTGTPAFAEADGAKQIEIDTTGMDIFTPQGQDALSRQVSAAARRVCEAPSQRDSLQVQRLERECYETAMSRANVQIAAIIKDGRDGRRVAVSSEN